MKPQLNQKIPLTIKRLGIHGEGIGDYHGFTVFVDGALPGEVVTVSINEVRKNFARGALISTEKISPHRVKPPCPVFGRCGGCQLMHLDYSQQLEIKRQMVIDALERIGKIFDIPAPACIPSPNPLSYRNKIQLPVVMDPHLKMGLYAFNSHEIVEIEKCYIHCQLGEKVFAKVKQLLQTNRDPGIKFVVIKTAVSTNQVLVVLVTDREGDVAVWAETAKKIMAASPEIKGVVQNINPLPGNAVLGKTYKTLAGESFIVDQICSLRFKVSPASFFQVNPAQAENLYRKALEFCELKGEETVLDAYCGVGTLSLLIAPHAKHVIGVECVPEAIADAKENARQNGITNTSFHSAQAEDFIETLTAIDAAVLNPPRKGCEPAFLDKLLRLKPKRIVYVSCDPATLARDLAILQKGYNVNTVQPFDMFPQTIHVESIVQLSSS
ncbi:MAG TPA: 23S rRNA (uracil(1939)-C(5))-methyltransferase RlmD [Rhabdochlamydiaceae bacterium]|jgi:23S rRNA (uracil1939-C5)-methyltransferase|nr:23S rRNA (uracil(1939)-C(5))-methyltransferase RlmD [Rhabdochlamydiaceae bacterium]